MIRFNYLFYLWLIVTVLSCSSEKLEVPTNILTEEKMIEALTFCYLSEGASGINIKNVETPKFDSTYAFNPLKDKGIEKVMFDSSLVFYSKHPKNLKLIYENVLKNLSQIQAKGKVD